MFNHRRSICLQGAIERFLDDLRLGGRAASTLELYGYLLSKFARYVGHVRLDIISHGDVVRYLSKLEASRSYTSLTMRLLKQFFSWCEERDYMKENPLAHVSIKADRWTPAAPFTPEESRRLLNAAQKPFERVLVLLLLDTCMRATELTSLRLDDIDLATDEIRVMGKGAKLRRIALTPGPRQALLAYLKSRTQMDGLLWPQGFNRKSLAYILDKIGRRAKVIRVHPHRFRGTFSCYFLLETNDVLALQQICGWESLAMVQRYTAWVAARRAISIHRRHSIIPK